jgi:hypothetical protein
VNVIANPTSKVDERSTFMLFRKGLAETVLDSTEIVVDVQASARPVRFTASFDADTINARIGDTVELRIRARTLDLSMRRLHLHRYALILSTTLPCLCPFHRQIRNGPL